MARAITAQQIVDRIKTEIGPSWRESPRDVLTGRSDTVTGIGVAFSPSIEILRRGAQEGKNLIISQQPAFYQEQPDHKLLANDPAYLFKKDFLQRNKLMVWRFYDNWNARAVDGQTLGLAKFLGWDRYRMADSGGSEPHSQFATGRYFQLPDTPLRDVVFSMQRKLKIKGIRVIGDPQTRIKSASLSHGLFKLSELRTILRDRDVDLVVAAEVIEWESAEYFRDLLTTGKKKAMIVLGRAVTEDPGYAEVASWLQTIIAEVPVAWLPYQRAILDSLRTRLA